MILDMSDAKKRKFGSIVIILSQHVQLHIASRASESDLSSSISDAFTVLSGTVQSEAFRIKKSGRY